MKPKVGSKAPDFRLPDQNGSERSLSDFLGQWIILYFYPKDDTPGCSKEARKFSSNLAKFNNVNAVVMGVSVDSVESHKLFVDKHELKIILLSDPHKKVIEKYGVWVRKKMMGREYFGTERTSFLIDPDGRITKIYEKVKPEFHAQDVLADLGVMGQSV